jgi:thioredoxin reductase (NADPH)
LYPDKPIYDIPAIPVIGAQELVEQLMLQIKPFGATFHLGHEVQIVERLDEERFRVVSSRGLELIARAVIIAGGVGSFRPRRLKVPGAEALEGRQVHYKVSDPESLYGKRLLILGGGDSALDWALELHDKAESVVLLHRRGQFRAQPASVNRMQALCDEGRMRSLQGNVSGVHVEGDELVSADALLSTGETQPLPADHILVFWGLHPNLGPIAEWGLSLNRKTVEVDTEHFETSVPGIYAVGDINSYPGKKKLILSGFHEAALAAFAIRERLFPEQKVHLQYTTTSPKMHERLGLK